MNITKKNAQLYFSLILALFWIIFGLMLGVVTVYLQAQGFSNSQIGLILGTVYLASTVLQPALAAIFDRTGKPLRFCLAAAYGVVTALTGTLLFLKPAGAALAVNIVLLFALKSALQSSVNSLVQSFELAGTPVNFGLARGVGSLAYGVIVAVAGVALEKVSPLLLPGSYLGLLVLMILLLALPKMNDCVPEKKAKTAGNRADRVALKHPCFVLFLIASGCFSLNAVVNGSFMLQIMQQMGGNSAEYGLATSIPAVLEFPAMILYSRFARRFGENRLLVVSGWAWFVKNALILMARSPEAIYAAQALQFISYALFIPGVVRYISAILPEEDFLKGQSLYGSAYTLGSVIATFFGGMLLDAVGVHNTLAIAQVFSFLGALLLSISVKQSAQLVRGGKRIKG